MFDTAVASRQGHTHPSQPVGCSNLAGPVLRNPQTTPERSGWLTPVTVRAVRHAVPGMSERTHTQVPSESDRPRQPLTPRLSGEAAESILKWSGIAFLFIAVAVAMNLARQAGWFGPNVRIAGGLTLAATMLGVGIRVRAERPVYSQTLEGGGLAIAFLTLIGGHQLLGVLPSMVAIAGSVAVAALAFVLAGWQRHSALAVIGLLGGLSAPFVLAIGRNSLGGTESSRNGLMAYVAVLMVAAIAVYFREGWSSLLVTASITGSAGLVLAIVGMQRIPHEQLAAQTAITVVGLLYWLVPVVRHLSGRPVQLSTFVIERNIARLMGPIEVRSVVAVPGAALLLPMSSGVVIR